MRTAIRVFPERRYAIRCDACKEWIPFEYMPSRGPIILGLCQVIKPRSITKWKSLKVLQHDRYCSNCVALERQGKLA
jgi:hypothetical protein